MAKELTDVSFVIIVITVISTAGFTECCSMVNNTLTSPRYPREYPANSDCSVSIPIPPGKVIQIHFEHFHLQKSSSCRFDYLRITNKEDHEFGMYCGRQNGQSVVVTGYHAVITFHSNRRVQRRGFLLKVTEAPAACGSTVNNTLTSPAYPSNYPHNMDCNYSVPIPKGKAMKVYFEDFTLETSQSCIHDYLAFKNGNNNMFGVFCGNKTGDVTFVTGDSVEITFHSDGIVQESGFRIVFTEQDLACGSVVNNTLTSPAYPNNYPNNTDCNYSVSIRKGKAMKVYFEDFVLETSQSCMRDYLAIKNDNNRMFGVFCGNKKGEVIVVTGDSVEITFHSDGIVQESGFRIVFTEQDLASYFACLSENGPWLSNSTTKCFCKSDLTIECLTLDEPVCLDSAGGKIRNNNDEWLISSCVKCTCLNSRITCSRYVVNITYGLFKVSKSVACEGCAEPSASPEPDSACEAFFEIPKEKLFHCSVRGSFIWEIHRCNGVRECPDGSDEIGCQDVICSYKIGSSFIIKDKTGWQASPCVKCNCKEGKMSCQKEVTVFFPYLSSSVYKFTEICAQPSCNVFHFVSAKGKTCAAIEVMENKGLLMKGQTYSNSGCEFYFDGPRKNDGDVCPSTARMACYIFNGGVCCTSECPDLKQITNAVRGNVTYCPSGRQLAAVASDCGKSVIRCSRDHGKQGCTSVATCQDEDSHKYFEGATWSVGSCINCSCQEGKILCKREIDIITSDRETLTEFCNQTDCNVTKYLKIKEGVCKACRWKGKLFVDGDHWKENGVEFYCSHSRQKVRPGCYVENRRVKCTGAMPGIRNLLKMSNSLFLCESGDEIRSLNDRCNGYTDCEDQSDERNCTPSRYYCGAVTQGGIHWERTQVNQHNVKDCSLMDPAWQGTFSRYCGLGTWAASWSSWPIRCNCERGRTVNYFKLKVAEVNEANFLDISKELSSSAGNFTNKAIFLEMFTEVFNVAVEYLKSSNSNSDLKLLYAEHVIKTISEEYIYLEGGFCEYSDDCIPPWFSERNALGQRALKLLHEVDMSAVRSIPDTQVCFLRSNFARTLHQRAPFKVSIWTDRSSTVVFSHVNTAPLISNGQDSNSSQSMPYDANITVVKRMGFGRSNLSDEIINVLEANGCKSATLDKSDKLIVKPRDPIDDVIKHDQIQTKLEIVLVCISVGAVIVYFIVLLALRIKKSEKTFVHVSLLLTVGLGNLIYVLDKTRFTNRMEFPALCSFLAVSQYFLGTALFTWMLVEGINLYIKMVKVFSVDKQYLVYTAMGWGIPAITVGAVAAIKPSTYDMRAPLMEEVTCGSLKLTLEFERTRCWINGSLWIYKGPVLFFLLVNLALFVILLRVVFGKLAVKYSQQNIKRTRKGMRSIMALLPLLGVTYLLGFFIEFHTAFGYIYILFNSTQGILFSIFHCFLDEQVCEAFKKLRARIKAKPMTNTSSTSNAKVVNTKDLTLLEIPKVASHPKSATLDSAPREEEVPYNTSL